MELPASLREINPVIDAIARGELGLDGPALRLAVALGLATPEGSLTEAGRAYARPALAAGPASLVMSPERRQAANALIGGRLPLQGTLRRLLRQIIARGEPLVAPAALGWPEALLRPYLAYLEDLGLLVPIGPLVEVTPRGRLVAAQSDPPVGLGAAAGACSPLLPLHAACETVHVVPHAWNAAFRYHLARRVSMALIARRGRREWHLLQPLLDGPLAPLLPAYNEWLARFLAAQGAARRSWPADLVAEFEARLPAPGWFADWCQALLGTGPAGALDALAVAPALLREPAVLAAEEPLPRETWLMAAAMSRASAQGWGLRYSEAAARLALDGVALPPWPETHQALEAAGLLVTDQPEAVRLVVPVQVQPGPAGLWPYASVDWLTAALLEASAYSMCSSGRRPVRV